jgi:hypothetical protein
VSHVRENDVGSILSRREVLRRGALLCACFPLVELSSPFGLTRASAPAGTPVPANSSAQKTGQYTFAAADEALLEDLEQANFQFFWDQTNPKTGISRDRCNVKTPGENNLGSIASTGFGLTALCIGAKRGYVPHAEAQKRALDALLFLWKKLPNHRGFFYHWADINTGERLWDSEVSSIDTSILLCGVLTCREYFFGEVGEVAAEIFDRVDWTWLSEDTQVLPHGWTPETGFLPYRWDNYSEMMMMYLMGLGSGSHPLPTQAWDAWKRTVFEYDDIRYIGSFAPLFIHQYSQAWFDFRDKRDRYADYFQNSIIATDVHRRFCIDLAGRFPDYSDDLWGITASDSVRGYVVWGGPPETGPIDGTVVPAAAGGSLPFLPEAAIRVLRTMRERYGQHSWCRYGFVDAFNPLTNWYDTDVIGIDTGITMLMAENVRDGFVWNTFMNCPEARRGMERAGFTPYQPSATPVTQTMGPALSPGLQLGKVE